MKPIGLVTCYYHHNYGSMLQAYATEMIMDKMGFPYLTIACKRPRDYMAQNKYLYLIKKIMMGSWGLKLGKYKIEQEKKKHPEFAKNAKLRNSYFDKFAQEMFHVSVFCEIRKELIKTTNNYSAFLVGSDQLWSPDSIEHGYSLLDWVPDGIRKIAYSTSIGVKKLPWFQINKAKKLFNRFDYIALREQSACDLVYNLTGKKVQVVLDPTLLFTGDDWMKIQTKEPLTNGKYIFCYLLGDNPSQRIMIKNLSKKTGFKIIALQHLDSYITYDEGFADEAPYNVGPKEFLNYIRNAEYVFTDSFHCSVFSIIYKKNFFTFSRFSEGSKQSTNTRIDNLLGVTGLQQRRIGNDINVDDILMKNISFEGVDEKLNTLRDSSMSYLKESLKGL